MENSIIRAHPTHDVIRAAREQLGLTRAQLGALLEVDAQTVQRMEMPPDRATHRKPASRMLLLIEAYLRGYRPPDWPL